MKKKSFRDFSDTYFSEHLGSEHENIHYAKIYIFYKKEFYK